MVLYRLTFFQILKCLLERLDYFEYEILCEKRNIGWQSGILFGVL
jgi:hypothetical protein